MSGYAAPAHWGRLSLGDLTQRTRPICYGVLKPGRYVEGGVPLIRVSDISGNRFDDSALMRISPSLDEEFRRSRLKGGEILLSIQGTVGRVAICPPQYAGANISRTIAVVEPDSRVNRRYAYWFLRFIGARNDFRIVGTTRSSLNIEYLRRVEIPVPAIPEQLRIASILDKADELETKRRAALQQVNALTHAIFLKLFGDPAANPKQWTTTKLSDVSTFENGDRSSNYPSGDDIKSEGVLFLSGANLVDDRLELSHCHFITEEKFASLSRGKARTGDLIITLRGTLGSCCVFDSFYDRAFINAQMMIIRPHSADSAKYLHSLLTSPHLKDVIARMSTGVAVPQLTAKQLADIAIPFPPLSIQKAFSDLSAVVDRERLRQINAARKQHELFKSLQARAFTGEL